MKILLSFFSFLFLNSLIFFSLVTPVSSAGAFTLSNGQVECVDPGRPYCIPEQELFSEMVINIAENGEVSGQASLPISFEQNSETFDGSASIIIRGTYDFDRRSIKGTYDYKLNLTYIVHRASGDSDPLNRTGNRNGSPFTGTADGNTISINFQGIGNVTYSGVNPGGDSNNENAQENKLEDSGAAFSDLAGQVEVNYPQPDGAYDEEDWHFAKLKQGETFPVGTHIKTSRNSSAILSFADMTTFTMGPESEIILSSPSASNDSQINLLAGTLWANVKKMMKDGTMEVQMSQAVAGIKGTTFILEDTKDTSTIKVIEGSVAFKSKTSSLTEMVNTGETITADTNGLGQKTTFDVNTQTANWDALKKETKNPAPQFNNIIYIFIILLAVVIIITVLKFRKKKAKK